IVAAHNEEAVIERRLDNLLGLDYPPEKLRILVASDASDDRTDEIVEAASAREPRVRLLACPRGGKVVAQNAGVRDTDGAVVAFTYLMVQRGRRAVYEPAAIASEKPTPTNETEYRRKVRMFEHCWLITLRGSMLRRLPPGYLAAILSHRVLRYASGVLHLVLLGTSIALAVDGWPYQAVLAGQVALIVAAAAGQPVARYY